MFKARIIIGLQFGLGFRATVTVRIRVSVIPFFYIAVELVHRILLVLSSIPLPVFSISPSVQLRVIDL